MLAYRGSSLLSFITDACSRAPLVLPDKLSSPSHPSPSLAAGLLRAFMWRLWAKRLTARGKSPCSFYLGHTRFATSSAPTVPESHPHRFSHPQVVTVWRRIAAGWVSSRENFEVYATHNGDLDYWPLFGVQRTQRELGAWLARILNLKGKVIGCDSVKVAGIIELLRTQGVWAFSLRLAFQQTVSPPFETTIEGDVGAHQGMLLPPSTLALAASIADSTFGAFVKDDDVTNTSQVGVLTARLASALGQCKAVTDLFGLPMEGLPGVGELAARAVRQSTVLNGGYSKYRMILSPWNVAGEEFSGE